MEFSPKRYYDQSKIVNSHYLIMMNLEQLFAQELFKSDGSRMQYASKEWAFRQRLNNLNKNSTPDFSSLDIPFGSYYRMDNWKIDDSTTVPNAAAALFGLDLEAFKLRFLKVKSVFNFVFFFNRDDEAQIAYETLLWLRFPSPKILTATGLMYKSTSIDLPIQMTIDDIRFNMDYKEREWLQHQRIFPIDVTVTVRSLIMDQTGQG
jgi:hypothetical protein